MIPPIIAAASLGKLAQDKAAQADLDTRIEAAKNSSDPSKVLEGEVAEAVRKDLVAFNKDIITNGEVAGEIDVETNIAVIEVTVTPRGKLSQMNKYLPPSTLNPNNKEIVLYAPNYTRNATRDFEKAGGYVVKSKDELIELLETLKKGK